VKRRETGRLKDLQDALRAEWWIFAYLTSGIGMNRRLATTQLLPNPNTATGLAAIEVSREVIDHLDREIEALKKEIAKPGGDARRVQGQSVRIIARFNVMTCPRHERATLIASQLGLSPGYVRRVLRENFSALLKK
jgi:hypothetical protein